MARARQYLAFWGVEVTILLLQVYRDCRRLLLHTEEVVLRFSRYQKYTVGTDLRQQAMALMPGVHVVTFSDTLTNGLPPCQRQILKRERENQ